MKFIVCSLMLALALTARAQVDTSWTRTVEFQNGLWYTDATAIPDEGFAVCGIVSQLDSGDIALTMVDFDGTLGQTHLYGGDDAQEAHAITRAGNGTLVILGTNELVGQFYPDLMVMGVSPAGDSLWATYFSQVYSYEPYDIATTTDGNVVFCAAGLTDSDNGRDVWIVKMNPQGDTIWTRTIDIQFVDYPQAITQGPDGTIYVTGTATEQNLGFEALWVMELDLNGEENWRILLHNEQDYDVGAIEIGDGGDFFIAGRADSLQGMAFVTKVNALQGVRWYNREFVPSVSTGYTGILPRADGGVDCFGYSFSNDNYVARAVSYSSDGVQFGDWTYGNVPSYFASSALASQNRALACGYTLSPLGVRKGFMAMFAPTTILSGRVLRFGPSTPIENAVVRVEATGDVGISDADGFYTLYTRAELSDITVSGPCISPETEPDFVLVPGQSNTLNFAVGVPGYAANPSSVNTSVHYDQVESRTVTITNNGSGDLIFTASALPTTPAYNWLAVSPAEGVVPLNSSLELQVSLNPQSDQGSELEFFGSVLLVNNSCPDSDAVIPVSAIALAGEDAPEVAREFALYSLYPNPFNATTELRFDVARDGPVEFIVYDLTGRVVQRLARQSWPAGSHRISFSLPNASSGVYYVRMKAGTFTAVRKAVLLK